MSRYIALLRGINVGGHKPIAMAALREMVTALGFADARSLLQSGNLVFDGRRQGGGKLERQLEAAVAKRFGQQIDIVVREAAAWQRLITANPFPEVAAGDPAHLVLMPLKAPPAAAAVRALQAAIAGPETLKAAGANLYITYPAGIGRSRLTNALIERTLGCRGTARNWNTVEKLAAMLWADRSRRAGQPAVSV